MSKRALVTGITGFIGAALARRLVGDGWQVDALVRQGSIDECAAAGGVCCHLIEDGQDLRDIVARVRPDVAFHLASLYLSEHRPDQIEALIRSNILLAANLAEALVATDTPRLVNTGTAWQRFGGQAYLPVNLYAATKQAAEDVLTYYADARGLSLVTLRLFDTYGGGDKRRKLIQLLVDAATTGSELSMSPGDQVVDLSHIDDVVEAFGVAGQRLMSSATPIHDTFYLSGERHSVRELAAIVERALGRAVPATFGGRPYRAREVMHPYQPTPAEQIPGWSRRRSIETSLAELLG